jgi:gamma-glutamyl-gamma-aminobutyrate hydrolase PuuD
MTDQAPPLVVLTVTLAARHADPELAVRKNERYAEAIVRHGGRPLIVDEAASSAERAAAFGAMDGLLLTGGADIDPARYGRPNLGSASIERERDALEAAAWAAADARRLPVLGICRGFQAINVFSGGTLIQDVVGHAGPGWTAGPARMHPLRIEARSSLGRTLGDGAWSPADELAVNTYHHQGVGPDDVAPGLVPTAWAAGPDGDLVEAVEMPGDRFVVGVQCHPERTEFTPAAFERLWAAFVDACRVPVST